MMKKTITIAAILACIGILYGIVQAQTPSGGYSSPSTGANSVTTVTGSSPIVSSGGKTPALSCPTCSVLTVAPVFSTTDTLTNTTLTSEQLFASNLQIPANTITANVTLPFQATLETTETGTGANTTVRAYLCPTQGSLAGCVRIYLTATAATQAGITQSGVLPLMVTGTAAAGSSVTVIAAGGGTGANVPIGQNRQSSIVAAVPTNAALFLQFTVQYANTTASVSTSLTSIAEFPTIH